MKSNVEEVQQWLDIRLKPVIKTRMLTDVDIENMVHWLENYRDKSILMQFSVDKVYNSTKKWMHKLEESGRDVIEQKGDVKILLEMQNGMYLVELTSESAYKYEGHQMGHCVASYFGKDSKIYSIRDKFNKPHCTVELNEGKINQIKGKNNRFVISEYVPYVLESLRFLNINIETRDMSNLGLIKVVEDELKTISKVAGCEIPTVTIGKHRYINNADSFWHE